MDDAEFQALIDTHGEDLRRWPAELRVLAVRHLVVSTEGMARYAAAQQLGAALRSTAVIRAPAGLLDRICAAAAAAPQGEAGR